MKSLSCKWSRAGPPCSRASSYWASSTKTTALVFSGTFPWQAKSLTSKRLNKMSNSRGFITVLVVWIPLQRSQLNSISWLVAGGAASLRQQLADHLRFLGPSPHSSSSSNSSRTSSSSCNSLEVPQRQTTRPLTSSMALFSCLISSNKSTSSKISKPRQPQQVVSQPVLTPSQAIQSDFRRIWPPRWQQMLNSYRSSRVWWWVLLSSLLTMPFNSRSMLRSSSHKIIMHRTIHGLPKYTTISRILPQVSNKRRISLLLRWVPLSSNSKKMLRCPLRQRWLIKLWFCLSRASTWCRFLHRKRTCSSLLNSYLKRPSISSECTCKVLLL